MNRMTLRLSSLSLLSLSSCAGMSQGLVAQAFKHDAKIDDIVALETALNSKIETAVESVQISNQIEPLVVLVIAIVLLNRIPEILKTVFNFFKKVNGA